MDVCFEELQNEEYLDICILYFLIFCIYSRVIRIHSFCIFYFLYFALRISYITLFFCVIPMPVWGEILTAYLTLAKSFLKKIPVSTCHWEEQHVTGIPSSHHQPEFLLCHHRINWNLCTTSLAGMPPSPPQYKLAIYSPRHSANSHHHSLIPGRREQRRQTPSQELLPPGLSR